MRDLAARDCVLFLRCIDRLLPAGLEVMAGWGFRYATEAFSWAKLNPSGVGWHRGTGYWTRANPERYLLGTRGAPKRLARDVDQLVVEPLREHSRKPDRINTDIARLVAGPYAELFARTRRPGWESWGDQVGRFGETFVSKRAATDKAAQGDGAGD